VQWRGTIDDAAAIIVASSADRGLTWSNLSRVSEDGRQGPLAADATSPWIYLPHTANGEVLIARSNDTATTWEDVPVAPVNGRPFIFPIAAVDAAGTLYVVWSADENQPPVDEPVNRAVSIPTVYLATSNDHGDTWSAPLALSTPGVPALFPWIAAGDAGRVVIAWYEGAAPIPSNRLPNAFHVMAAVSVTADTDAPVFETVQVSRDYHHIGAFCTEGLACSLSGGDRSMLDFFEVRILPDGSAVLAYAADGDARMASVKVFATRMTTGTPLIEPKA
jgi:hypothetical protein